MRTKATEKTAAILRGALDPREYRSPEYYRSAVAHFEGLERVALQGLDESLVYYGSMCYWTGVIDGAIEVIRDVVRHWNSVPVVQSAVRARWPILQGSLAHLALNVYWGIHPRVGSHPRTFRKEARSKHKPLTQSVGRRDSRAFFTPDEMAEPMEQFCRILGYSGTYMRRRIPGNKKTAVGADGLVHPAPKEPIEVFHMLALALIEEPPEVSSLPHDELIKFLDAHSDPLAHLRKRISELAGEEVKRLAKGSRASGVSDADILVGFVPDIRRVRFLDPKFEPYARARARGLEHTAACREPDVDLNPSEPRALAIQQYYRRWRAYFDEQRQQAAELEAERTDKNYPPSYWKK
jgi:hypothetical protein